MYDGRTETRNARGFNISVGNQEICQSYE
jgi:hypothetical protein